MITIDIAEGDADRQAVHGHLEHFQPRPALSQLFHVLAGPQHVAHPLHQELEIDRLGNEIGSPGNKGTMDGIGTVESGDHQDWGVFAPGKGAHLTAGLTAILARHDHVEQHEIRLQRSETAQRRIAIARRDRLKTGGSQGILKHEPHQIVIIDHQDDRLFLWILYGRFCHMCLSSIYKVSNSVRGILICVHHQFTPFLSENTTKSQTF